MSRWGDATGRATQALRAWAIMGALLLAGATGCGASDCTPGEKIACPCDGASEEVVCRDDGTTPPCLCGNSAGSTDGGGNIQTSGSLSWGETPGTVFDSQSGLMWQREHDGLRYTWEGAVTYCDNLVHAGFEDWKLPHRDQLETIVLSLTTTPSIDTSAFPNTPAKPFWTRTLYPPNAAQEAFGVDFENGGTGHAPKTEEHFARCVRTPPVR